MDNRKWLSGAAGSPPSVPSSPSSGYPTGGDPLTNTPPTNPGPWWFHAQGEELRNVIVAAGLTPSISVLTQLKSALDLLYGGGNLILVSGVPKGFKIGSSPTLVIQWGSVTVTSGGTATFTYPQALSTAVLHVFALNGIGDYAGSGTETLPIVDSAGLSSCVIRNEYVGDNAGTFLTISAQVLVIGY